MVNVETIFSVPAVMSNFHCGTITNGTIKCATQRSAESVTEVAIVEQDPRVDYRNRLYQSCRIVRSAMAKMMEKK